MAWRSREFVPYGVNLGGWFVLEDWFYSKSAGDHVGHHVNTDDPGYDATAKCLKTETFVAEVATMLSITQDEANQLSRPRFGCECDLVNLLLQAGISEERIVELFWGHRRRYIRPVDFARIRALGIRRVRLPLTWCLSYDTPYVIRGRDWHGQDTSTVVRPGTHVVEDPFTNDPAFDPACMACPTDKWISIPIRVVESILETAASYGIEVLLDIHAYPGGSAAGTFAGVWPLNPRFWTVHREENLRIMMTRLYDWMESLASTNPAAYRALYGVTPLNEPAHMRGLIELYGMSSYDLRGHPTWAKAVTTQEVLKTLGVSVEEFRKRKGLVESRKQLVMNIIETAFPALFGGEVSRGVFGASQSNKKGIEAVYEEIAIWWKETTTVLERESWAVLDIHNYIAWNGDVHKFREVKNDAEFQGLVTEMSTPFFVNLRQRLDMPKPQRLACSEYSASTNRDTLLSITSGVGPRPLSFPGFSCQRVRDLFLLSQHKEAETQGIEMWFWTYHIRNNVNYQGEWSLQHILSPWPRLWRSDSCSAACREALHCVLHSACWMGRFLLAAALAPCRSLWGQSFGLGFQFYGSQLRGPLSKL